MSSPASSPTPRRSSSATSSMPSPATASMRDSGKPCQPQGARARRGQQEDRQAGLVERPARDEGDARPVVQPGGGHGGGKDAGPLSRAATAGCTAWRPKTGELLWKFDCNPKKATPYKPGGRGQQCFIVATPVVYDNKLLHRRRPGARDDGNGVGHLWCIDITKTPKNKDKDLSPVNDNFDPKAAVNKDSGLVWHHGGPVLPKPKDGREYVFGRTMSTVAVHDGLVYAAELAGYLQCLDAKTGKKYWEYDFEETTWCSPYYVDGKVYIGTDGSDMHVFKAGKTLVHLKKIDIGQAMQVPRPVANGVLYINAGTTLYAVAARK